MEKFFTKKVCAILGFIAGATLLIIFGEVNAGLIGLIIDLLPGITLGCVGGFVFGRKTLKKGRRVR